MLAFFHTIIYQPLYNILIFLYNVIPGHDFGISIIIITVFLKAILIPVSKKQLESQKKMQELQPKIKEIQAKYKNDKEKQTKAMMEFYKTNKANPLSGCLPLIVQLIFLIAIYRILFNISNAGLTANSQDLYSFVANPGQIRDTFLGIISLAKPSYVLAVLAAASQFYQSKLMMSKQPNVPVANKSDKAPDFTQIMNKQMLYLGPILTLFIGIKFPAGLALYWLVSTLFTVGQQLYMEGKLNLKFITNRR